MSQPTFLHWPRQGAYIQQFWPSTSSLLSESLWNLTMSLAQIYGLILCPRRSQAVRGADIADRQELIMIDRIEAAKGPRIILFRSIPPK